MGTKGKKVLGVMAGVLAFVVAFLVVRELKQSHFNRESAARVNAEVQQKMANAASQRPDLPPSEAIKQQAVADTEKKLAVEPNAEKRAQIAADTFWGFYFVNTRMRHEFCKEQGVDIRPFVSAFERAHTKEVATAKAYYAKVAADENRLYEMIRPTARKVIERSMQDFAATQRLSLAQACQSLADAAHTVVPEMHFSRTQPTVFKALTLAP